MAYGTTSASSGYGTTSVGSTSYKPPTSPTPYVSKFGKGNPYSQLQYLKNLNRTGTSGQRAWAQKEAMKYYDQIRDKGERDRIAQMNDTQLGDWIKTSQASEKQQHEFTPTDSYSGSGNPYSQLLYLKGLNANGTKGQAAWAQKEALKYYKMLDPMESQKIAQMNNVQLAQYINSKKAEEARVNPDNYHTDTATMEDLANKYGFKFSREDAARQAEAEAAAKRAALDTQKKGALEQQKLASSQLDQDFFQQFRNQAQGQVNSGLNAGIAADQDLRLGMNRQNALGELNANTATELFRIGAEGQNVETERLAREDALYNQRLQQMFDNALGLTASERANNAQNFDQNFAKQQYKDAEEWKKYIFNNMSYADRQRFEWEKERFGEEQAMQKYLAEKGLASEQAYYDSMAGYYNGQSFNEGSKGGGSSGVNMNDPAVKKQFQQIYGDSVKGSSYRNMYKTQQASKSKTYQAFTGHFGQALKKGGFPSSWTAAMTELVGRESSWNPQADNPTSTAYGYGQFLDSTRSNYKKKFPNLNYNNPVDQLVLMMHYVKDRYGTPEKALQFWDKNNWY